MIKQGSIVLVQAYGWFWDGKISMVRKIDGKRIFLTCYLKDNGWYTEAQLKLVCE